MGRSNLRSLIEQQVISATTIDEIGLMTQHHINLLTIQKFLYTYPPLVPVFHHEAVGGIYKTDEKRVTGTNVTIASAVDSYSPGISGTYNMNGNVAEMIEEKGIALGGSWNCLGYDIRNTAILEYDGPKPFVGFRIIMTVDTGD